jgi:hypothetical protein
MEDPKKSELSSISYKSKSQKTQKTQKTPTTPTSPQVSSISYKSKSQKTQKTQKTPTSPEVSSISYKSKSEKTSNSLSQKKKSATRKIANFLRKSKWFTQLICSRSGECLSFGKRTNEIKRIFNGFTDFSFVENIQRIGAVSANGFITMIEYNKEKYKSYALLKSSITSKADNLLYEFIVGKYFINKINKKFPCFLETYGFYYYNNHYYWDIMKTKPTIENLPYLTLQKNNVNDIDFEKACEKSKYISILIQHIHNADLLKNVVLNDKKKIYNTDLIYILFIIYHALNSHCQNFTHYDLHMENVLLFKPATDKYIHYHYYFMDGTTINFKCQYVPKIIDYGRSFFDNKKINSSKIFDKVCPLPNSYDCGDNCFINFFKKKTDKKCGEDCGFLWFTTDPIKNFGMNVTRKNESHDLRLIHYLNSNYKYDYRFSTPTPTHTHKELNQILEKIVYSIGIPIQDSWDKQYGTQENTTPYVLGENIENVTGAYLALKNAIRKEEVKDENDATYSSIENKIGDFNIYEDGRDMEYIRYVK